MLLELFSFVNFNNAMAFVYAYIQCLDGQVKWFSLTFCILIQVLLAHLSRRLIGELIVHVYKGIRRPSVCRPSVRLSTFSNDISSEAIRPILFIFHI